MWRLIKKFFASKNEEPFLILIAGAREESSVRERLLTIWDEQPFERQKTLKRWIKQLEAQEAPIYFSRPSGVCTTMLQRDAPLWYYKSAN